MRARLAWVRFVGLVFVLLGAWVLLANLVDLAYPGWLLAWILASGAAGLAGGVLWLLAFDGPERFRVRRTRILGLAGMLILSLLPTSLSIVLLVLVVLAIPAALRPAVASARPD